MKIRRLNEEQIKLFNQLIDLINHIYLAEN